jgi:hypothetical protein
MMLHALRPLVLLLPLLLWSCALVPGKFVSTLSIDSDRRFAFTYLGEVHVVDMPSGMAGFRAMTPPKDAKDAALTAEAREQAERKWATLAATLQKEAGYRSVEHLGKGRFRIDYAARGTLSHPFLFPFSSDAEVILPFIAIELRGPDRVRVKAPGYAASTSGNGIPDMGSVGSRLDGTFTLTTTAEIVSQNSEDGPTAAAPVRTITWRATPATKDAPLALLKVAPLTE